MQPPEWTAIANCRGMDPAVFFPSDGVGVQEAVAICADCPARVACLEYALENRIQHGIFGGQSERARDRILRERRRARRPVDAER
jgi:WhiB family redox-sensing transcriptional regulator